MGIELNPSVGFNREKSVPLSFVMIPERVPLKDHNRNRRWKNRPSRFNRILEKNFQVASIDVPTRFIKRLNTVTNIEVCVADLSKGLNRT